MGFGSGYGVFRERHSVKLLSMKDKASSRRMELRLEVILVFLRLFQIHLCDYCPWLLHDTRHFHNELLVFLPCFSPAAFTLFQLNRLFAIKSISALTQA